MCTRIMFRFMLVHFLLECDSWPLCERSQHPARLAIDRNWSVEVYITARLPHFDLQTHDGGTLLQWSSTLLITMNVGTRANAGLLQKDHCLLQGLIWVDGEPLLRCLFSSSQSDAANSQYSQHLSTHFEISTFYAFHWNVFVHYLEKARVDKDFPSFP